MKTYKGKLMCCLCITEALFLQKVFLANTNWVLQLHLRYVALSYSATFNINCTLENILWLTLDYIQSAKR